jgi:hypothetical protein
MSYTPETLDALADLLGNSGEGSLALTIEAHVDAWKKDFADAFSDHQMLVTTIEAQDLTISELRIRIRHLDKEREKIRQWIAQAGHIPGCGDNWLIPYEGCVCGKDEWLRLLAKEDR